MTLKTFSSRSLFVVVVMLVIAGLSYSKDQPPQVIVWPPTGQPVVRFSFGKFKEAGSSRQQRSYTIDVTAENLWGKTISKADFSLYLFDKDKIRIGDGYISISDVAPRQVLKFQIFAQTSGTPTSMELAPRSLPPELQSYLPPKGFQ